MGNAGSFSNDRIGTTLELSSISSDITGLVINAGVEVTAPSNQLTLIKLTGEATSLPM